MFCKEESCFCILLSVISAIIAAVGIASAFFAGVIVNILILIYITLIMGALTLLGIISLRLCNKRYFTNITCLIASSVGSIVTSAFALAATTLATGSMTIAILIGIVAFFLIINSINVLRSWLLTTN